LSFSADDRSQYATRSAPILHQSALRGYWTEARRSFVPARVDLHLIGIALPEGALDSFLRDTAPLEPAEGFSPEGESGYFTMAKRREQFEPGGRMLGSEALNIEFRQVSHSWLCNQLETHCAATLGIRPNAAGFIETLEDAQRCCDEISREEVGSEPGPWLPFALVEYEFPR
jgi:hypothetical protein